MAFADYFSPVAFFISLREALEAGIIIAVLLGFINQIVPTHPVPPIPISGSSRSSTELLSDSDRPNNYGVGGTPLRPPSPSPSGVSSVREEMELGKIEDRGKIVRAMRLQIWTGAILGGLGAAIIGAIFLYVFYTYTHDLWQDAENLWEGGFCAIAAVLILIMGLAFLRLPHAQTKWRLKLLSAYEDKSQYPLQHHANAADEDEDQDDDHHAHVLAHGRRHSHHRHGSHSRHHAKHSARSQGGRMILFGLPFITVLREGLEGVVFLGGIGLSEAPPAIAGGAVVGLVVGGLIAYLLFSSTLPLPLRTFTTSSTLLLFLIGAGLASRAAYSLERQYFINGVGTAAAESGTGPGSYRVDGNIWKLTYGNPEPGAEDGNGYWQLAQSIVGWNNIGTVWTVSTYIGYWLVIIATLVAMKWKEGRTHVFGVKSQRGWQRELVKRLGEQGEEEGLLDENRRS